MGDSDINPYDPLPPISQLKDETEEQRKNRRRLEESHREAFDSELREIRDEIVAEKLCEEKRRLEEQNHPSRKPSKTAKRAKQNRCNPAVLKILLEQLATYHPPFVDPISAKNYEAIYERYFKNANLYIPQEKTPHTCINWAGQWSELGWFYQLLRSTELVVGEWISLRTAEHPNFRTHAMRQNQCIS